MQIQLLIKAGLTNQQVQVNNVIRNSTVTLTTANGSQLNISNITYGSGNTSTVTASDPLQMVRLKLWQH
ncbi:hypothetical protein UM538_12635 [Staphylococcus aureus]|nr:hypothetical protein UM538_12635 [Staphylococcus aureus]